MHCRRNWVLKFFSSSQEVDMGKKKSTRPKRRSKSDGDDTDVMTDQVSPCQTRSEETRPKSTFETEPIPRECASDVQDNVTPKSKSCPVYVNVIADDVEPDSLYEGLGRNRFKPLADMTQSPDRDNVRRRESESSLTRDRLTDDFNLDDVSN